MNLVSIPEFISITNLSPADALELLARGLVRFERDDYNRLLIDIDSITADTIARSPLASKVTRIDPSLIEEVIANEASTTLLEMFNESLEMAIRWGSKSQE